MPTFDVVSEVDLQEVDNALNQARKEIEQRYDFRGSGTKIDWDKKDLLTIESADDFKVRAAGEVLKGRFAKRSVSLDALDEGKIEPSGGGRAKQEIRLKRGIEGDLARELQKAVKATKIKVQIQVQGDQLRVSGKKKDDLQEVMRVLRAAKADRPLQFTNFRD